MYSELFWSVVILDTLRIQSECGKIRTRITSNTDTFQSVLTMTCATRGSSKEKLYQELSLETLHQRELHRKLCCFHKILGLKFPSYLHKLCTSGFSRTMQCDKIPLFNVMHNLFRSFFPSSIIEWNNLDTGITNSELLVIF